MNTPKKPISGPADVPAESKPRTRKPYEKTGFAREQLFETMALACGKTGPVSGACRAVNKAS